ncbi:conserved protein of unknown function [Candidatus Filomicrobium marinum]|uniref:Phasin domain-containing protein n=2 Tax=Filomicrobium TaxID=119044 RepID=A0A0D6JDU3_9HYPH|nr:MULTISPECIES: hypothetical protein [Filomicrobium]MCV0367975.1 hypothetical protein [Filomicrobium sp.]CFX16992.1 conserved protein of unknown function [Candidatus Filomicrobium marinum]CPR18175.1 conserved protein of unknown function [Candidatus Filomicrobium marinum]SDO22764.1 hypothetical protein SAMN04488061_0625 [Filomicrobium insigne]
MASSSKSKNHALTEEAREAAKAAFDALAQWRDDMAAANERYSTKVFDQMAQATRAMGWPDNVIETTRMQMQNASQMQLQMMDQVMEAWSEQLNSPTAAMPTPTDFMEQLQRMQAGAMNAGTSGLGFGNMPGTGGFEGMAMAPFQMWMQAAEMWQRNMASAMSMWTGGASDKRNR